MAGETTLVWAPTPLDELGGATGFVQAPAAVAARLLEQDAVQDPTIGAHLLRSIGEAAPQRAAAPQQEAAAPAVDAVAGARAKTKPRGTITKGEEG